MDNQIKQTIKKTINLPIDFSHRGNISQLALVQESGYLEIYEQVTEEDIAEVLKMYPQLINEWLQWSADNRSSSKWGFTRGKDGKCFVGHWPEGKEFEEINTVDEFKACAAYIRREMEGSRKILFKTPWERYLADLSFELPKDHILQYGNRALLYQFLVDDYEFKIQEEKYYSYLAGNFHVELAGQCFLLRYYHDRHFLSVDIASYRDKENWYPLSFIKDLVYNPDTINANKGKRDNSSRIKEANDFLMTHYDKICELFNDLNYPDTKKRLDEGLRKQFYLTHPSPK